MILIFDGPDKVGKTTLIREIDKATNYQHIMIDRGPTSYLVYDKLLGRETFNRRFEYLRDLKDLESVNHLCIYLEANEEDVEKRLKEVGEEPVNGIKHVEFDTQFNFELFLDEHRCTNTLVINTSFFSIEDNVKSILRCIEHQSLDIGLLKLKKKECHECVSRDSLEYIEYYPSYNSYSLEMIDLYCQEHNLKFNKDVDSLYYDMLTVSLNHMLHKKEIGWINHRQLTYTSNDCISFIQLVPIDINEYDLVICQRSLDLVKHGYNDLLFFTNWIKEHNLLTIKTIHYNVLIPHAYY